MPHAAQEGKPAWKEPAPPIREPPALLQIEFADLMQAASTSAALRRKHAQEETASPALLPTVWRATINAVPTPKYAPGLPPPVWHPAMLPPFSAPPAPPTAVMGQPTPTAIQMPAPASPPAPLPPVQSAVPMQTA